MLSNLAMQECKILQCTQ